MKTIIAFIVGCFAIPTSVSAQFEPLQFAICKKLSTDGDRLKCYDAIGKRAGTLADEPPLERGKWVYTESKSPVDDSPQIVAALQGENADKILVFRCQENRTDAVFIPGAFFLATNTIEVLIRINSDAPETISMIPGTNNRSLFIPAASAFMKLLPDNAKLFFRATLPNGEHSDATFELADVSVARDRVADTCHWSTPKGGREKLAQLPQRK